MNLFADHDRRQLDRIERLLIAIARKSDIIIHMENTEMASVADIQAEADDVLARVTANTNALDGIKTLLQSQSDQINTLNQELKDAIANGADPVALQAISDKLTAVTQATDAQAAAEAALANTTPPVVTPAPPATPPAPPPVSGNAPTIVSLSPDTGHAAGGDSIVIAGSGLASVTSVNFGGTDAPTLAPNHDASLTVTTPPGTGTVDVTVTNPNGTSAALPFTFA